MNERFTGADDDFLNKTIQKTDGQGFKGVNQIKYYVKCF
jgi:hypothetical protein